MIAPSLAQSSANGLELNRLICERRRSHFDCFVLVNGPVLRTRQVLEADRLTVQPTHESMSPIRLEIPWRFIL